MLTLLLLRHGKSSWDDPTLDDFDRPLAKRGTKAAALIGGYIATHGIVPDLVLCSTAVRTRATLTLVLNEISDVTPKVFYDDGLYLADAGTLIEKLQAIEGPHNVVMLIGHNPGLHAVALELTGSGRKTALQALAMQFPTAAMAHITFEADSWRKIGSASGQLVDFILPRKLS